MKSDAFFSAVAVIAIAVLLSVGYALSRISNALEILAGVK